MVLNVGLKLVLKVLLANDWVNATRSSILVSEETADWAKFFVLEEMNNYSTFVCATNLL